MPVAHIPGFPRMGERRELKFALERHWRGESAPAELEALGRDLRQRHWRLQADAGLDLVTVGDFAWYDHVLEHIRLFGAEPSRFGTLPPGPDGHFALARGTDAQPALELTKWFDTNYHYLVPEYDAGTRFSLHAGRLLAQLGEAIAQGHRAKPVLLGPLSLLWLGKSRDESFDRLSLLPALLPHYQTLLTQLHAAGAEWVQLDEPVLALDLPPAWLAQLESVCEQLAAAGPKLLLAAYFGPWSVATARIAALPVAGVHIDATRAAAQLQDLAALWPADKVLSVGCVDGRNVWRADLARVLDTLHPLHARLGECLWLSSSCSLLHVPMDLSLETSLPAALRPWLAFARQKLDEIALLSRGLAQGERSIWAAIRVSSAVAVERLAARQQGSQHIGVRVAQWRDAPVRREPFAQRQALQQQALNLPPLPTTTIGSFPQTGEIRRLRALWRQGEVAQADYRTAMQDEIRDVVQRQERLGLDVLVHGEPERNDMVEYFGELLDGYLVTEHGWVQSYGSRCVKPPILYGDIVRSQPMTVEWARYAQSLTQRPMKGMLTGPVTMLQWSFVRDDQPRSETALQLALAIRDEVLDLEAAGIRIIQVDEPALREGLPLRHADWAGWLDWAVHAFRVAVYGVRADTQIHTHMCYAEFNDILPAIAAMDADVITIETSRSQMELLRAFADFSYPNAIGPGVWDIHSPRVPAPSEMRALLDKALDDIELTRLWVNPDCGCKTRRWPETEASLSNMVHVARELRQQLAAGA